ncbi:MAG: threonylcarbamoyl-AMP synthase [Opitutaceae bacterium]|nr:threonylcarbamoyl-AMP synthase [Opitutaceae bacterium]
MTKPRQARIYQGTPRTLARLARRLQQGDVVAVPTETVYGLAGNALDAGACAKIFAAKGRPADDPLIVHIHSLAQLPALCRANPAALTLARKFWPGPLTLVLPKTDAVPALVTAGRDSVAIRMPRHPLFRRLLKATGLPLAAPSANPFGYISPTTAEHVQASLGRRIRYILDGGPARHGLESTIVDLRDPRRPAILRPGVITAEAVAHALGRRRLPTAPATSTRAQPGPQVAPGLLARHYSPRTPVVLHDRIRLPRAEADTPGVAWVFQQRPKGRVGANVHWLDPRGRLPGVARRLFALLRRLDALGLDCIHVERARGGGLADAINDRLRRAAAR